MNYDTPPGLEVAAGSKGKIVRLSGQWTALALARDRVQGKTLPRLRELIDSRAQVAQWDLSRIERMDHVGGQALWRVWGYKLPVDLVALNDTQRDIFDRIALLDTARENPEPVHRFDPFTHQLEARLKDRAVIGHLFGVPTATNSEDEAARGEPIDGRNLFRGMDGIALDDKADARGELNLLRYRGGSA